MGVFNSVSDLGNLQYFYWKLLHIRFVSVVLFFWYFMIRGFSLF